QGVERQLPARRADRHGAVRQSGRRTQFEPRLVRRLHQGPGAETERLQGPRGACGAAPDDAARADPPGGRMTCSTYSRGTSSFLQRRALSAPPSEMTLRQFGTILIV